MLDSIAQFDRTEASAILAQAAKCLLGDAAPELAYADLAKVDTSVVESVIGELRTRVRRKPDEDEEQHLGRLSGALSRAMSETVLAGVDLDSVRARAGQKGTLPTGLYRVTFTRRFDAQRLLYAIKKSYVTDAIAHADATEHLRPKSLKQNSVYVSLFAKTPRTRAGSDHTILVKCNRIGAELHVEDALYLFHDTFDLKGKSTPTEMLLTFLSQFGLALMLEACLSG
jgi:hypothetical protein